jgi:hypothetical protein
MMIALSSRYDHVGPVVVANQRQVQLYIHPSLLFVDIPNTFKLVSIMGAILSPSSAYLAYNSLSTLDVISTRVKPFMPVPFAPSSGMYKTKATRARPILC